MKEIMEKSKILKKREFHNFLMDGIKFGIQERKEFQEINIIKLYGFQMEM